MLKTRLDDPAVLVQQWVLPATAPQPLPPARDVQLCIPFFDGLVVNDTPCPKLMPTLVPKDDCHGINTSGVVGLAAVLALYQDATLLAFGSRIHGNAHSASDLDLMILSGATPGREYSWGKISIQFETPQNMTARAKDGDLFVKYLCDGARAVHDPQNRLAQLTADFKLRRSYARTIQGCSDVAFMLMRAPVSALNPDFAARKLIWALRTTSMAEGHDPFIAPQSVAPEDMTVINAAKRAKECGDMTAAYPQIAAFFHRRGGHDPQDANATLDDFRTHFDIAQNPVGARLCDELVQKARKQR